MSYETKDVSSYAATAPGGGWARLSIKRRTCQPDDVEIDIKFAGICHSDIHQVMQEWGPTSFPMVPGHEIGGIVSAVGSNVTNYKVGDQVGVGCMVDSCRTCEYCASFGEQQYCVEGATLTYNSKQKWNCEKGALTQGGYSKSITVDKAFVCSIPASLDLAAATPLLCAGITVYAPMEQHGLKKEHKAGVIGLGGLGHMAVKFMKARGNHTTVISRGAAKKEDAISSLKADSFLDSKNEDEMKAAANTFDFLLCTVSAQYDLSLYLNLLKVGGKFIVVGAPAESLNLSAFSVLMRKLTVAGSLIGGIKETQDMLNFCGEHNITCDIEMITADEIETAYTRTVAADVKYRFVIDVATI